MAAAMAVSITHHRRHSVLASCHAILLLVLVMLSAHAAATSTKTISSRKAHVEAAAAGGYRTFIVFLEPPTSGAGASEMDAAAHQAWHESFLPTKLTDLGEPRLLRSYRFIVNGFAARLTEAELQQVASKPGFVAAFPNAIRYLQTTHTPAFLGLLDSGPGRVSTWKDSDYGYGVIVGILDGSIDPHHPSMSDIAFPGEVPERWKGSCPEGFGCNRKLIGAKNMVHRDQPPRDGNDHGTHTATTAAGSFVNDVSINGGLANGTASGMAPFAHVAVYKVCEDAHNEGCPDAAILHAMDEATNDGVDVLSLSLSGPSTITFDKDPIAIAAFSAMEKGVPVVACAGNEGPNASSVENDAPWILTVGAGSVDRSLEAKVRVTSGDPFFGESVTNRKAAGARPGAYWYPILYREEGNQRHCLYPEAERQEFRDKIIVCESGVTTPEGGDPIHDAIDKYKAAGVISVQKKVDGFTFDLVDYGSFPVVQVSHDELERLKAYASRPAARASLSFGGTVLGTTPAPIVGSFSGRGPSKRSPAILKPDLLAPGVNILAGVPKNEHNKQFEFKSGTSMATPHVGGLVALFRTLHPHWSPAAIRSAFVTTADVVDNTGKRILDEHRAAPANAYATGAGHVNVARALDPGLVYDINIETYTDYVCSILGEAALRRISRDNTRRCSPSVTRMHESNLNYPTITVPLQPWPFVVARIVTNVAPLGPPESYTIKVDMPPEVRVTVNPSTLTFTYPWEKASYILIVSSIGHTPVDGRVYQGTVTLTSSSHTVRTPMLAVVGMATPQPSTGWTMD